MNQDDRVEMIYCSCGCGGRLNKYDGHYRTRKYISGHNNRKYKNKNDHKRVWLEANREQVRKNGMKNKRKYYKAKRLRVLAHMGNKCIGCGIEHDGINTPIFDFHHIDPSTKDFSLSSNGLDRNGVERVLEEAEKCVILCANCHRLHHHTDIEIIKELEC